MNFSVGNFYFWPLLGQKNKSYPSREEIHALSTWTIIKNEYFVAKSIEFATKRVADRSPYDHKGRAVAWVATRTLNYLEQLPGL